MATLFSLCPVYDGGHFLLVEERTQIHYTLYLGRDNVESIRRPLQLFALFFFIILF
jgi:hypothetical protein